MEKTVMKKVEELKKWLKEGIYDDCSQCPHGPCDNLEEHDCKVATSAYLYVLRYVDDLFKED